MRTEIVSRCWACLAGIVLLVGIALLPLRAVAAAITLEPSHTGLRLVGEESTPAIFEPEMLEMVSPKIPPTWAITSPKPGCLSLEPKAWSAVGFWERFFDGDPDAVAAFKEEQAKIVAADP